jgi:hypothetical protein
MFFRDDTDLYGYTPFKKQYKRNWGFTCNHCKEKIRVPKEPIDGGYYNWAILDNIVQEYTTGLTCSEKCIKEIVQIYKQRKGIE